MDAWDDLWREAVREAAPPSLSGWLLDARRAVGADAATVYLADEVALRLVAEKGVAAALERAVAERLGRPFRLTFARGAAPAPPPAPAPEPVVPARRGGVLFRFGKEGGGRAEGIRRLTPGPVAFEGRVFDEEVRRLRSGGVLHLFAVTDHEDSVKVKLFLGERDPRPPSLTGRRVAVRGELQYDRLERDEVVLARGLTVYEEEPEDPGPPRFDVHVHTTMSQLDGLIRPEELAAQAQRFGLEGVVVTDHGVVQAYPELHQACRRHGVALRYGIEAYVVDEEPPVVGAAAGFDPAALATPAFDAFVALDFETTSLTPRTGEVIEIGAVAFAGGRPAGSFHALVRPERPVPENVLELTNIPLDELETAPRLAEVLERFLAFVGERPVVAHNAAFDRGFLRALRRLGGRPPEVAVVDTLALGRSLFPDAKSHRLPDLAALLGVPTGRHHRALDDALVCGEIFARMRARLAERGLPPGRPPAYGRPFHVLGVVVRREGLTELYRLVTKSHLEGFHRVPRLTRGDLRRPGILWGAPACFSGEAVAAWLRGEGPEEVAAILRRYDFAEIPLPSRLVAAQEPGYGLTPDVARALVVDLREAARRAGIPAVFGSDAHHLRPEEQVVRAIARRSQGDEHAPSLPLVTTRQALEELREILPDAEEVVVEAGRRLFGGVEAFPPVPEGLHAPEIAEAEERVREDSRRQARALYGDPLPPEVALRLERELDAILGHGFAVVYHVARLLVETSRADGYAVGSRGSVGSSFVAYLLGITEVNPLPPHHLCPGCTVIFSDAVADGFDLPSRPCPRCGRPMRGEGHDIPFETFLGFEGDKVPDIDLNFSGEEQPRIHRRAEEIFGRDHVYRAGTIATVAERTAYGLVRGYLEEIGANVRTAEVARLAGRLIGVKRTTGQHPGGLMIVPRQRDVHEFTPLQRPADDPDEETVTTHFDYSAISSRLLKLDLLGHDDPTVLRLLADLTGIDPLGVPLDDPPTLALFSSVEPLGISPEVAGTSIGTLGIPEFGTRFVRTMLEETRPSSFGELVRISGLSHGTDVWTNNARDLIRQGEATLREVIATRDDILLYLLRLGVPKQRAFQIMEQVRKGKGLTPDDEELMRRHGVPEWYLRSCRKIAYMFPKAHAVAYVTMAVRIAYFKVHHPAAFYASYFTVRAEEFDLGHAYLPDGELLASLKALEQKGREATPKERALVTHLELVREMFARGIRFAPVSLAESDAVRYLPQPGGRTLLPPFAAVPGLGRAMAAQLAAARQAEPFRSRADLRSRTRLPKPAFEALERLGALAELPEDDQATLFAL